MNEQPDDNPLEQLIELFVYAPIGMLYEYPEVLPRLVKKGRSQVQLAKFFGQMAARQRGASIPEPAVAGAGAASAAGAQAVDVLAGAAAKFITELGAQIGLAPQNSGPTPPPPPPSESGAVKPPSTAGTGTTTAEHAGSDGAASGERSKTARLPIAGYDDLTAKEIIGLLEDLTADQLVRVRDHETNHRNRKTVLAKIDRLLP